MTSSVAVGFGTFTDFFVEAGVFLATIVFFFGAIYSYSYCKNLTELKLADWQIGHLPELIIVLFLPSHNTLLFLGGIEKYR
jgi:hypothetical protein